MSFIVAREPTLESGPTGTIVTPQELSEYLGSGSDVPSQVGLLTRFIVSATDLIEQTLGYRFRRTGYEIGIPKGRRGVPVWLTWGPAASVAVEVAGAAFSDFERETRGLQTIVCVDTDLAFSIEWTVGATQGWPSEVELMILRVAGALYHDRGAGSLPNLRRDIRRTLPQYQARSDWLT